MLENTFCHMPSVGTKTERRLWGAGVQCWADASPQALACLGPSRADVVARHAEESAGRLAREDARYFAERLPAREHWRLFPAFRHSVAYLDIETTGLGGPRDYVTTIALYDGRTVRHYVHGENLDEFPQDVRDYRLLVTYNGKTFDLPFLRHYFGMRLDQAHVDLRYVLHSLGYKGGLKGCERQLGLDRGELAGVDGYFAVLLWRDYLVGGNERALETLIAYNVQDTVNLETLMVMAHNMKAAALPLAGRRTIPLPPQPPSPCQPDLSTIRRLRDRYFAS
jgi:uncharacterized protein YprB with RNaseH-like and TPR domain